MIFSYVKHYFIFFNVNEHLAVPYVAIDKRWFPCGSSPFLLFTQDYLSEYSYSHISWILHIAWNLPLLAFCFLCVCMVDQTQMYPSSISPLKLFQGIICNIHSVNPLIYRGLGFLKNHRRRDQDFLVKMGSVKEVSTAFHY